jgi:hypothetical protein
MVGEQSDVAGKEQAGLDPDHMLEVIEAVCFLITSHLIVLLMKRSGCTERTFARA